MMDFQLFGFIICLLLIHWIADKRNKAIEKRLNLAEEMIHDLANQYMILLRVRVNNEVIELRPEMALREKLH